MSKIVESPVAPVIFSKKEGIFTNSRDVAAFFGKRHDHVLRDIDNLIEKEPSLAPVNFGDTPYIDNQNGQTYRSYDINHDGFTLLAMGFTGAKALKWKIRYIEAFNAMEAKFRSGPVTIDVRDPSQLATIAVQLIEMNKELETRAKIAETAVEVAKPKVGFYDSFANSDGLYGLQNTARILNEPPNKFIGWLKQEHLFYQGGCLVPRVEFRQKGIFEVKATMVDDKARYQTYVTPKGVQYFARKLSRSVDIFKAH